MKFLSEKLGVAPEKHKLVLTAYFVFFVTGMASTILGTIIPNLREACGLNYLVSGSLFTLHQTGNLCAVILAGFLPYLIGRKKSVTILYSGLAIGTILITASGLPVLLMAAYSLTGVGRGTTSNITNVIVSESSENKGAGLNLLHAIFAFGALVSPFILLLCSSLFPSQGWRITLWILALCMIVSFFLFATSSLSNKAEVRRDAEELLEKMGLAERADYYPYQLSGGQQQRVAIARALNMKPKMLFFDEPTSALDPELTAEILKVLKELAEEKMTMVIVTHEIAFARSISDHVVFMDGGVIVEQGKPADVIDNPSNERRQASLRKLEQ
jgi:ABC-type dipeptide/oligopeptide/nickel transport system ATPase component